MTISVFGLGYVGTITSACLVEEVEGVIGVDVNTTKVRQIQSGKSPVTEPGLGQRIAQAVDGASLRATTDGQAAVRASDVSMICVGTPCEADGRPNIEHVENVCREIGGVLAEKERYHTVIVRSTVPPGTTRERLIPILEDRSGKRAGQAFGICANPEFLREGSAIDDYFNPPQIIVGAYDERTAHLVDNLYRFVDAPFVETSIEAAEMVKYVSNSFHALKVAFANEVGSLCKAEGIDGQEVMDIMCRDHRLNISSAYLRPGFAFGGSCLPKDLRTLVREARQLELECPLLRSVLPSNEEQIQRAVEMISAGNPDRVGILGLSFKCGTDDVRESPVITLIKALLDRGCQVSVYDDELELSRLVGQNRSYLERELPQIESLLASSLEAAVTDAEVVVMAKRDPSFRQAAERLGSDQLLVDLVGLDGARAVADGRYEGICW